METKSNPSRMSFIRRLDDGLTALGHRPTSREGDDILVWQVDDDDSRYVKARFTDRATANLSVSDPGCEFCHRRFNVSGLQEAVGWVAAALDGLGRHCLPPGGKADIPVK